MIDSNGADEFYGWILAMVGARTLLGKYESGSLKPVYDFSIQVQPTQQGLQRHAIALPLLWLSSIESVKLPEDCIKIPLNSLSKDERLFVRRAINEAEQFVRRMRAAESGIIIPSAVKQ